MTALPNPARKAVANSITDVRRLWREPLRVEQRARLAGLQIQTCDQAGQTAWEEAAAIHRALPLGVRVDLPSVRVFSKVLGLYRTALTLRNRPMAELELSAEDIAKVVGYSKAVVEAALRWLGDDAITYRKQQVARGLGFISRVRRTAKAYVNGKLRSIYRTSRTFLTFMGRGLLGLEEGEARVYQHPASGRRCQGKGRAALVPVPPTAPDWERQMAALKALKRQL